MATVNWKKELGRADFLVVNGKKQFPDYYRNLAIKMASYTRWRILQKNAPYLVLVFKSDTDVIHGSRPNGVIGVLAPYCQLIITVRSREWQDAGRNLGFYALHNGVFDEVVYGPSVDDVPDMIRMELFQSEPHMDHYQYLMEARA